MKKLISCLLAIATLISLLASFSISVSAATANADVIEISNITFQNVKTSQYLNNDYNTLKNGNPVRVWPRDGSPEQSWSIKRVSGNTYRILTGSSSKYCIDVYRGSAKLKVGQLIDIWSAGADAYAQNITFYLCDDGSYILRMAEDSTLAIGAPSAKGRCQLVKFNAADNSQKWNVRDAKGNKIDILNKGFSSVPTAGIPASAYKKTGLVYTISGVSYCQAKTTREYNGVQKDSLFYVKANGAVVTDANTLNKLFTLALFNEIRVNQCDAARLWASSANDFYYVATKVASNDKLGVLIGKSCGMIVNAYAGNAIGIKEAGLEIGEEFLSPDTFKTAVLLGLARVYANDTVAYGNQAVKLMKAPVNDYETMLRCADLYAQCSANFSALDYLVGDTVREMANTTTSKQLLKYFEGVIEGFADSIIPDIKSVEITKYVTDGFVSLTDFAVNSGANSVYSNKLNEQKKYLAADYSAAKKVANNLAKSESLEFVYPLKSSKSTNLTTQAFGAFYPGNGYHLGVDLGTKGNASTTVNAIADGTVYKVVLNNKWSGWGNLVIIQHKIGTKVYYSGYGHLANNTVVVKEGQAIKAGQKIGSMGSTGNSSGPHLHLIVYSGSGITKNTCPQGYSNTKFTSSSIKYKGIIYYDPIQVIKTSASIIK